MSSFPLRRVVFSAGLSFFVATSLSHFLDPIALFVVLRRSATSLSRFLPPVVLIVVSRRSWELVLYDISSLVLSCTSCQFRAVIVYAGPPSVQLEARLALNPRYECPSPSAS